MEKERLFDLIEEAALTVDIVWSTLEALCIAILDDNYEVTTYHGAVRGAADNAFRAKNCLEKMLVDINQ